MSVRAALPFCLALLSLLAGPGPTALAQAEVNTPARVAEAIRADLVSAQIALARDPAAVVAVVDSAHRAFASGLAPELTVAQADLQRAQAALAALSEAARAGDAEAFAADRAAWWTALLDASHTTVVESIRAGDAADAQRWLGVREFRQATRFERTGVDATVALDQWQAGAVDAETAIRAVDADLLDTYQARLTEALTDLRAADVQGFATRRAENAALAAGYFTILEPAFRDQRGEAAATDMLARFQALGAISGQPLGSAIDALEADLAGFRAAPLSPQAQQRRAGQLLRYLQLVPVEYGRAVSGGQVTQDIELQEAISFRDAAESAFADLRPDLEQIAPEEATAAAQALDALEAQLAAAQSAPQAPSPEDVQAAVTAVSDSLSAVMPEAWRSGGSGADFDVVEATLNQMENAVRAGAYDLAESARLEAYAIMETGPEARLMAFAPGMKVTLEELFWNGQGEHPGLAYLLRTRAPLSEVLATRRALDEQLKIAEDLLSQQTAPAAVATNAGLIVFREGLEAVVILASLMSSLKGASQRLRRPLWLGGLLALAATALTWIVFRSILTALARYGELLEAVVSLIAIGVLLLITNWFFHKIYWTDWIASFHSQKRRVIAGEAGLWLGLASLGFTSVYREGFETALFLQALVLDAGTGIVMAGVAVGAIAVALVGFLVFRLQVNLPQKRMLIVTGVLIGGVLLMMVGTTTHVLQVIGWLPIHTIAWLPLPVWTGMWLGLYATWEGVGLQALAAAFVIGSYVLAENAKARDRADHGAPRQRPTGEAAQG